MSEINWAEEAGELVPGNISDIAGLVEEMLKLEDELRKLEEKTKQVNEQFLAINQGLLPEAMMAAGLAEIKHTSGRKMILEKFYQAKIPDSCKDAAFKYLEDIGADSIIKVGVSASFGKGERAEAEKAVEALRAVGCIAAVKEDIHHATLKAFVKEQIESGATEFPTELFGVYVGNRIKIK